MMPEVKSMAVIGAGTMGSGVALVAATASGDEGPIKAYQVDISDEQLERAQFYHERTLKRNVEKQRMTQPEADAALARISYHNDLDEASDADWAVEAVIENAALKKDVFRAMEKTFRGDVVLATNTSSISITDLATAVAGAGQRVIGMHFFNPVPVMKLVEVIRGQATSEATVWPSRSTSTRSWSSAATSRWGRCGWPTTSASTCA
jgi:3-hydroxybutyryl-CoA dehydrogenase